MNILVKLIVCMALLVSNTAAQSDDGSGKSKPWVHVLIIVHSKIFLDCPGGVRYIIQPPTELNCNPMGVFLQLLCHVKQDSVYGNVTWYWSRCVHDAGINGTAIEPGDTSDAYGVFQAHASFSNTTHSFVIFQATNATLGYYWCEIDSAEYSSPLRSSVITPVLQPTNASLPACDISSNPNYQTFRSGPECAAEGSPIVYPRKPLPSFCPSVRNVQHIDITLCGILFCRSLHQCNQYHAMTRCYHLMLHCQVQYHNQY